MSESILEHNRYQREYYESTDKRTMRRCRSPYIDRQIERLINAASVQRAHTILEIGCGQGRYTLPLVDRGFKLTALDLSPVLLERLRTAAGPREISLVAADIAAAPKDLARRFDRVIGFFTLHHMHDLDLVFRGVARALKPGGILALLEPVPQNPLYYLQIAFTPKMTWRGERGLVKMRTSVVYAALRRQGFVNCQTEKFGLFPPGVVNTLIGSYLEDALQHRPGIRIANAFQIFSATLGA
jgi:SAM-dependent methyltransferase